MYYCLKTTALLPRWKIKQSKSNAKILKQTGFWSSWMGEEHYDVIIQQKYIIVIQFW